MQRISDKSYKLLNKLEEWGWTYQELKQRQPDSNVVWIGSVIDSSLRWFYSDCCDDINAAIKSVYEQARTERGE